MNRRQRQIEKKRKKRNLVKKRAQAAAAARPSWEERLLRAAARGPFGPCAVSAGWDDEGSPALVSVVVTRQTSGGDLLPALALVDRTCLGVKDGFVARPVGLAELEDFLAQVGDAHGGMEPCEPLVAQSIVFHAIDYARKLGFEPHHDFHEALFGPRPDALLETPWHAAERPCFILGPHDDARRILARLNEAVGAGNFDWLVASEFSPLALDDDDFEGLVLDDDELEEGEFGWDGAPELPDRHAIDVEGEAVGESDDEKTSVA
jgi:hypothetical protein